MDWIAWSTRVSDTEPVVRGWRAQRADLEPCPTVLAKPTAIGGGDTHRLIAGDGGRPIVPAWDVDRLRGAEVGEQRTLHEDRAPRPPYRRPGLRALYRRRRNGLRVISTFAGCGGSSTGHVAAGYEVLAAVEFVELAAESYRMNHPSTQVLERDVRHLEAAELMDAAGISEGELDLLDGSPPCEPFSTAGVRDKNWGKVVEYSGKRQRTDDLFLEFARLVEGIRPRAFIAENVAGLVRGKARGYFRDIHRRLAACGYRVEARLLDAQWLGVPQRRERLIFVGVREDLGLDPAYPDPLPYRYTLRDALRDAGTTSVEVAGTATARHRTGVSGSSDRKRGARYSPDGASPPVTSVGFGDEYAQEVEVVEVEAITANQHSRGRRLEGQRLAGKRYSADLPSPTVSASGLGQEFAGEQDVEESVVWDPGRKDVPARDRIDEPSPCVTVGGSEDSHNVGANSAHFKVGTRRRKLTIEELKSICGFPADYRLAGSYARQWERLGDAVPPPMMERISRAVAEGVLLR